METYDLGGSSMRDRITVLQGCLEALLLYEESVTPAQRRRLLEIAKKEVKSLSQQLLPAYAAEVDTADLITWPVTLRDVS